jgi:N-acetylglutamate synthase-like GNAT family acetyltransferase
MVADAFIPGAYWTPARAGEAWRRMEAAYDSPAFQETIRQLESNETTTEAERAREDMRKAALRRPLAAPVDVRYRRGAGDDVARITELMVVNDLPAMFIDEFLEGFCVAEAEGDVIGCGGAEMYDDSAVLRSIAVDERARGLGVGRRIAELLVDDARMSGAHDVYLFTEQAAPFWRHIGFVDVPFEEWKAAPRTCWQYRFLNEHRDLFDIHTMWRRV